MVCQGKPSRCPSPSVPEGVYYTGSRDVGSKIRFHCPEGHMPEGGGTEADCLESGEWSSLEPVTRKHVDCGQGCNSIDIFLGSESCPDLAQVIFGVLRHI